MSDPALPFWRGLQRFRTRTLTVAGVAEYASEVRGGQFPAPEHCYSIDDEQLARFRAGLD